jgi:hypothetical protein
MYGRLLASQLWRTRAEVGRDAAGYGEPQPLSLAYLPTRGGMERTERMPEPENVTGIASMV